MTFFDYTGNKESGYKLFESCDISLKNLVVFRLFHFMKTELNYFFIFLHILFCIIDKLFCSFLFGFWIKQTNI